MAQGVRAEAYPELGADLEEMLEHLKWNLWHGKVDRALELLDELAYALDLEDASPAHRKLLESRSGFRDLRHQPSRRSPELWGTLPRGKNRFDGVRGVARQPGGKQTVCEKAADVLAGSRGPPLAPSPNPSMPLTIESSPA